jgi:hypothetical protein
MWDKGAKEGVGSKGMLTTLAAWEGASSMGQFNADMELDLTGIRVCASNNRPRKLFTPY